MDRTDSVAIHATRLRRAWRRRQTLKRNSTEFRHGRPSRRVQDLGTIARCVVPIEIDLVRNPHLVPQSRMVTAQFLIPPHPTLASRLEWDIHPDRQVKSRE